MIFEYKNISLILEGSFYPIHQGHIELLLSCKEYLELNNHDIIDMIFLPTHFDSLVKKFVGMNKNNDDKKEFIQSFLSNCDKKIIADFGLIDSENNAGVSNYIRN